MKVPSRVVVELVPGPHERATLVAAAALAERIGAELVGIFVEDLDLLRFAALPFAHEVCFVTAQRRRIEASTLERSLRDHAAEAERLFASTAGQTAGRRSFRVARGIAAGELFAAAVGAPSAAATHALRLLLLGDSGSPATRWVEQARLRLGRGVAGAGQPMLVSIVHAENLDQLACVLQQQPPDVVILRADESLLSHDDLQMLLRETATPVLLLPQHKRAGDRR